MCPKEETGINHFLKDHIILKFFRSLVENLTSNGKFLHLEWKTYSGRWGCQNGIQKSALYYSLKQ